MKRSLLLLGLLCVALAARAQLTIDITTSGGRQIPIAIAPMAGESAQPQSVTEVIGADLARTGLFRLVNTSGLNPLPTEPSEVQFPDWAGRGAEALVIGKIEPQSGGRVEVRFRLFDVQKSSQLASYSYVVAPAQLRATAHRIADVIYERLTGDKGVFSTKITYVVKRASRWELQVADADGFNAQSVLASKQPIMSPSWSPDGSRIAYVSFANGRTDLWVMAANGSGQSNLTATSTISEDDPAWSPDGTRIVYAAASMADDGEGSADVTYEIWVMNADGSSPVKLTSDANPDWEPNWSPDGSRIVWTGLRPGTGQLFTMPAAGGAQTPLAAPVAEGADW